MNKMGAIFIVLAMVIAAYLFILATMPVLIDAVSTANTTMSATSNMSNYPGTTEAVLATPWVIFFVPAIIGMIVVVLILRKP